MSQETTFDRATVEHIANLAHISLTDTELDSLTAQLGQILQSVEKISEVAGDDVPTTSHPLPLRNITRKDEVRDVLTQEQALQNAPAQDAGQFVVTSILGEEQ